jgi:hypothetical protein
MTDEFIYEHRCDECGTFSHCQINVTDDPITGEVAICAYYECEKCASRYGDSGDAREELAFGWMGDNGDGDR